MDPSTRLSRFVRRVAVCAALLMALAAAAPAASAAPKPLEQKNVIVLIRGATNEDNIYIWGHCTDADEHGLWLDQTHVQFWPNGVQKKKARVYLPFSSVAFVKFDQG